MLESASRCQATPLKLGSRLNAAGHPNRSLFVERSAASLRSARQSQMRKSHRRPAIKTIWPLPSQIIAAVRAESPIAVRAICARSAPWYRGASQIKNTGPSPDIMKSPSVARTRHSVSSACARVLRPARQR